MNDFNTLFPNFLNQCAEMNRLLTPVAFVLLAVGVVSSTVTGQRSASAYLRTIGRTLAFVAVLAYLATWGNEISVVVDSTVKETLKADPAGVYDQYQKALAVQKGTGDDKSWWDLLDSQALFETGISWMMWVLGFFASVIVSYAYLVQKFILYVGRRSSSDLQLRLPCRVRSAFAGALPRAAFSRPDVTSIRSDGLDSLRNEPRHHLTRGSLSGNFQLPCTRSVSKSQPVKW